MAAEHLMAQGRAREAATRGATADTPGDRESAMLLPGRELVSVDAYVIAGVHRSGTSLVSRIANLLGLNIGPEDDLLGSSPSNRSGHWEIKSIIRFNDELLRRLGGSWERPPFLRPGWETAPELDPLRSHAAELVEALFPDGGRIGWKDPRMSVLLPFWRTIVHICGSIIPVRSPSAVAASLAARDRLSLERGADLWLKYIVHAWCHSENRIVVHYDDCFSDLNGVLDRLASFLEAPPPDETTRRSAETFLDPELRHHGEDDVSSGDRMRLANAVFHLLRAAPHDEVEPLLGTLYRHWRTEDDIEGLDRESGQLRLEIGMLRRELAKRGETEALTVTEHEPSKAAPHPSGRKGGDVQALPPTEVEGEPEFIQLADGRLYALEGGMKRRVASALLWRTLETVFGRPRPVDEEEVADVPEGPRIDFVRGPTGPPVVVVGGKAYPVRGLPVATPTDVSLFPNAEVVLDFAAAQRQQPRRRWFRPRKWLRTALAVLRPGNEPG